MKISYSILLVTCLILLAMTSSIYAQLEESEASADTILSSKVGFFGYPYAFYTPETQLAIGAGALVHFKTGEILRLRPSKVLLSGYYTTNDQYYISLAPILFLANKEQTRIESKINYGKEISKYYGAGNETLEIDNPDYTMKSFNLYLEVQGESFFLGDIYSGPIYDFSNNFMTDKQENPYLNNFPVTGSDGGKVSGIGWAWLIDNRDNIFYPSDNGYYKFNMLFYGSSLGSDFTYNWFTLDLRQYFTITDSGGILAAQIYSESTFGEPPFFKLPALGGAYRMRGYFTGRYRDKHYLTAQAEYRQMIWWRLGFVTFIGAGEVAHEVEKYSLNGLHYSVGFGLRYVFDEEEKINIRMDVGFGKDTSGIYFAMEEAF